MHRDRASVLFALVISFSAVACAAATQDETGSPTVHTDAGPHGDGASASDTRSATESGSSDDTSTPSTASGDDACAATGTNADCQSCCADAHKDAYDAFVQALHDCGCKSGVCEYRCATTFCAATSTDPSDSCASCLDAAQTGACQSAIDAACGPGGPCAPFDACVQTECASLP